MNSQAETTYRTASDLQLLQLIKLRNSVAFETLYDRHAPAMFNLLLHIVHSPEVAEELLQDVFWQIWRKAEQFSGSGSVTAWLMRIARNKAFDELRRQRSRPQYYSDYQETLQELPDSSDDRFLSPEQSEMARVTKQELISVLERIPSEQRHCLELAFYQGLSHHAIAEQTNTPLGTIKSRLRCGLAKMERILRGMGYQESYA